MAPVWWVLLALLVLTVGLWLWWTANRLDRMHHRIEVARASLDAQLLRRSGATLELTPSDALDTSSPLAILDAAHRARNATPQAIEVADTAPYETPRAVRVP